MYTSKNAKSSYWKSTGIQPNTIKKLVINRDQFFSKLADFKLTETDFEFGPDSTGLVRERTQGSKLEGAYQKRKGILLEQTDHTMTFLPAEKTKRTILSKGDIGRSADKHQQGCSEEAHCRSLASRSEMYKKKIRHNAAMKKTTLTNQY